MQKLKSRQDEGAQPQIVIHELSIRGDRVSEVDAGMFAFQMEGHGHTLRDICEQLVDLEDGQIQPTDESTSQDKD